MGETGIKHIRFLIQMNRKVGTEYHRKKDFADTKGNVLAETIHWEWKNENIYD